MKRTTRMHRAAWVVLMLPLVAIATTFQNCSKVDFATAVDPSKSTLGEKKTMYQEAVVGQANVPPLKLVFIVDNSFTMQANQISLSSAFGSMFSGNNASNLAPFDSTAYIFTTAQVSLAKGSGAFGLLPTLSIDQLRSMNATDLASLRGDISAQVDGKFPGDLVSYSVSDSVDPVTTLKRLSYNPTPVLGINMTGSDPISLGAHKDKAGSVSDLAADFSQRIAYISPTRSKVNAAGQGPLDPVIDKESGLCALARVLKNNSSFLKKGDLAAYVIVSDEDDADPAGANCVDAYQDYKDADLINAHCETPQTKLTYYAPNPNTPTCSMGYQKGFTYEYTYDVLQSKINFKEYYHKNPNVQTTISYKNTTYKWTNYGYTVRYYTSNPTYSLKQVNVSWFTKSTACKVRDGVQYDCVDTYAPQSATVEGTYTGANCSSFSSVATNAVKGDATHPITCAQGNPKTGIAGACPTNPNAFDCNPNYAPQTYTAYDDSNSVACSTLIAKLPGDALKSGVPAANLPSCDAPVARPLMGGPANGTCAGVTKTGCTESVAAASSPAKVALAYTGTPASCQAAVDAAVTASKIPAHAIKTVGATNGPTCVSSDYLDANATIGACTVPGCQESQVNNANGIIVSRRAPGVACDLNYAKANGLPQANVVPDSITCDDTLKTPTKPTGTVTYSATSYPALVVAVGDACPSDIAAQGVAMYGASTICKIKSVNNANPTYMTTCAGSKTTIDAIKNNAANHVYMQPTDNNSYVNQPYQTQTSSKIVDGTITCNTKCADAGGACGTSTSEYVKDVYFGCTDSPSTAKVTNPQTGVLASMKDSLCTAPAKVVVESSYVRNGTTPQYVAGSASANGDPNALINYIKSRSQDLLGTELPATSVFVRQSNGGNGGTEGKAYKAFASAMGGSNFDVTSSASVYASSLQSLSGVIKDKLNRSFSIQGFDPDQVVTRAWYQAAGTTEWIEKQEGTDWTASGGTVTVSQSMDIHTGDSFRFEYK